MPNLANVHIDVALTNLSVAYQNEEYVAAEVFPIVPVEKRSNKYLLYNKDTFLRSSGVDAQGKLLSARQPGTRSQEQDWDVSRQSYFCDQFARNHPVPDAEVELADQPLQPAMDATESLTETLQLDNEIAVAGKAMLRSNYAAANKVQLVNGTTSWAAVAATSKPVSGDIKNGKTQVRKGILRGANRLLLSYDSALQLKENAEYVDRIKYVSKETLTNDGLAPTISGLIPIIGTAQKITSGEGAAAITNGYVWADDQGQNAALVYYRAPSAPSLKMVALGLTFDAPDDTLGVRGFCVKRWREEWIDAERVEVRMTRDWRFTCTDGSTNGDNASGFATGGYLISGTTL